MKSDTASDEQQYREDMKIDLSGLVDDAWKGFKRFWLLLLLIVIVCAGAGFGYTKLRYMPQYTASETFYISAANTNGYSATSFNNAVTSNITTIFPYLLNSNAMKKVIKTDLGISYVPDIKCSSVSGTNIMTMSVTSSDPVLANDVLVNAMENYNILGQYVTGNVVFKIMDKSGVPTSPDNYPQYRRNTIIGAAAGVAICIIFLIVYAVTRKTIRKEEDLKKIFNGTVLGSIPMARFKKRASQKNMTKEVLIDNEAVPHIFLEAVRTVRTRLERIVREKGMHSFVITSSVAGEGKSTVSKNIAISLTHRNYRVLLIDGDIRKDDSRKKGGKKASKAALKGGAGSASAMGLHEVLAGKAQLSEVLQPYGDGKLTILPSGSPMANPTGLISSKEIKELIAQMRKSYDFVIIDTPPSAILSDAAIMARYVEGVIYVIRQDYATKDQILEGQEMFLDSPTPVIGCVLNDSVVGITGYGYGYGYGYGRYGYGYGYGYGKKYGSKGKGYGSYGGHAYGEEAAETAKSSAAAEKK
ncbi:MAG: polysaccharide biosynthesis tyrosine autokinase [Lachnospiraceae bacterium]|nr:polysaccharide biosynthesis tyrosine autokinase [Lachnospiraceae bacterium]